MSGESTFPLSTHPLMDTCVASSFGYCESRCYEHGCADLLETLLPTLLGINSDVELLDPMVIVSLIF